MDLLALASAVGTALVYSAAFYYLHNRSANKPDKEAWDWVKALPTLAVGVGIGLKGAMAGDAVNSAFIFNTLPIYAAQIVTVDQVCSRLGVYDKLRPLLYKVRGAR